MPFKTTRGALEETLLALGYSATQGHNEFGFPYVEFRHASKGAAIALQVVDPKETLNPSDLLSAEHSVEWSGITDVKAFYKLLRDKTPKELLAA